MTKAVRRYHALAVVIGRRVQLHEARSKEGRLGSFGGQRMHAT